MTSVFVAYLHPNTVTHSFMDSLWNVADYERTRGKITVRRFAIRSGPMSIDANRNVCAQQFLDSTGDEWLWMVDNDMGFAPDIVSRLVAAADPTERPVLGGHYVALLEGATDGMGGWATRTVPTSYRWAKVAGGGFGFAEHTEPLPAGEVTQVAGVGCGCLLIHRTALEKVRADHGDRWFSCVYYEDGRRLTEDLSFCWRLSTVGVPVHVHTGIRCTHYKSLWLE